jgi:hypothetical protein
MQPWKHPSTREAEHLPLPIFNLVINARFGLWLDAQPLKNAKQSGTPNSNAVAGPLSLGQMTI